MNRSKSFMKVVKYEFSSRLCENASFQNHRALAKVMPGELQQLDCSISGVQKFVEGTQHNVNPQRDSSPTRAPKLHYKPASSHVKSCGVGTCGVISRCRDLARHSGSRRWRGLPFVLVGPDARTCQVGQAASGFESGLQGCIVYARKVKEKAKCDSCSSFELVSRRYDMT